MFRQKWLAGRKLVLLDYDGTLVPIQPTPQQALLPPKTRELLRDLRKLPDIRVGLISGRALSTLRRLVRVPGLIYAGNHGLELAGPGISFIHPMATWSIPIVQQIAHELVKALKGLDGAMVENKRLSLSVHWRRVRPSAASRFHRIVAGALSPWVSAGAVWITKGKRVIEVRPPVLWHKGTVVEWLAKQCGVGPGRLLYVGDDQTDEDAFQTVNQHRGLSVVVGARPGSTQARWRLKDSRQVGIMLRRLCEELA